VLLISQNNAHVGKSAKKPVSAGLSGTVTRVRQVKIVARLRQGGRRIDGGGCVKRKKKNDIERVTGRNRPQKTVKSRALVRGWGVWVAVENKRTREKPVGGIAWAKTRPLEARGDPHESAGQAFLFRLFRSMGHPGNNRVRNGLPPNGRACTSLRARQG
jgi:hypothetical protein